MEQSCGVTEVKEGTFFGLNYVKNRGDGYLEATTKCRVLIGRMADIRTVPRIELDASR